MATSSANRGFGSVVGASLVIVAVGVLIGGAHSWVVQGGLNPVRLRIDAAKNLGATLAVPTEEQSTGNSPRVLEYEISTDDAYALWADGLAVFLDARPLDEYQKGHIAYARYLDYEHLYDAPFPPVINELLDDQTQTVVFYCTGGECDASHNAATYFQGLGFTTLHVYADGYPGWEQAGYEIEQGPDPFMETD